MGPATTDTEAEASDRVLSGGGQVYDPHLEAAKLIVESGKSFLALSSAIAIGLLGYSAAVEIDLRVGSFLFISVICFFIVAAASIVSVLYFVRQVNSGRINIEEKGGKIIHSMMIIFSLIAVACVIIHFLSDQAVAERGNDVKFTSKSGPITIEVPYGFIGSFDIKNYESEKKHLITIQ